MLRLADAAAEDPQRIPREEQNRAKRRYFSAGPPEDGQIDWSRPAAEILRFVRAADYSPFESPWGHPRASLAGRQLRIVEASATGLPASELPGTVMQVDDSGATVATGDELILVRRASLDGRSAKPKELLAD
jgi:methionyl-tRNA formyltransferase